MTAKNKQQIQQQLEVTKQQLEVATNIYNKISGLQLIENFITMEQETELLDFINQQGWSAKQPGGSGTLSRRTQHYGYIYNYGSKDAKTKTDDIPNIIKNIFASQVTCSMDNDNNEMQAIINEYKPGQGIASHIDNIKSFGPKIMSLSLGSDIAMTLSKGTDSVKILLPRRSLLIMVGDARYKWYHGIDKKIKDKNILDVTKNMLVSIDRGTRVSITIRSMLLPFVIFKD